jgi:N-hydroxyarylamine O-acetyltransferase
MVNPPPPAIERAELIDRYLASLGIRRAAPSLALLSEILRRHVAVLPFASVGPMLGDSLPLELKAIFERLVVRRRGGYCFEQNGLLHAALEQLGFTTRLCLARVIYNQDIHPGLTHRIVLVAIDGLDHVVDAGFGPLGPRLPLRLDGSPACEPGRDYRAHERRPGQWHVQVLRDGEYYSLYRFELLQYGEADCEVGHFYSHRHPRATFVNNLVASRIMDDEVRSLRNRDFWLIRPSSTTAQRIDSADRLGELLADAFDLCVEPNEVRALYARLP